MSMISAACCLYQTVKAPLFVFINKQDISVCEGRQMITQKNTFLTVVGPGNTDFSIDDTEKYPNF